MEFLDSVLIVGGGAREHALLKAMLRSDRALCMYAYPGNAGMENDGCMLVEEDISSWDDLAQWAVKNEIDMTVVGPEQPLAEGVVDIFRKAGLAIFGPTRKAAQIEGSKYFAKQFMKKYAIPTASFESFTDKNEAWNHIERHGAPVVIKADGLAAGKGVIVCNSMEEAGLGLERIFDRNEFGNAGKRIVIEEKLIGEELSVFVLADGKNYRILPAAQDHKAAFDNDRGPNTGGMGAYTPVPLVTDTLLERIDREIIGPTISNLAREGILYQGVLFVGLMITADGPKVVEYNCRFGDPEIEAIIPLIECDWFDVFSACAKGTLRDVALTVRNQYCIAVVLASEGYPGKYEKGHEIIGIEAAEWSKSNVDVYHGGTRRNCDGNFYTNGGRVLTVSVWADSLEEAISVAYENIGHIKFKGKFFRHDIGAKGLARLRNTEIVKE